jgi:predicted Kef-type K+ transport protein
MHLVMCRRLEFKWGPHESRYNCFTLSILSITLCVMYILKFGAKRLMTLSVALMVWCCGMVVSDESGCGETCCGLI